MAQIVPIGFSPQKITIPALNFHLSPLPDLQSIVEQVRSRDETHGQWTYAPRANYARIFDLPFTHQVEVPEDILPGKLDFQLWVLSFFLGIRMSRHLYAHLDCASLQPGNLVDFNCGPHEVTRAVTSAGILFDYALQNRVKREVIANIESAIHALFLSQGPHLLDFEAFQYVYTAIDTCWAAANHLYDLDTKYNLRVAEENKEEPRSRRIPHAQRLDELSKLFSIPIKFIELDSIRNDLVHEGLFFDKPLGFAGPSMGNHVQRDLIGRLQGFCTRVLVAIITTASVAAYISSPSDRNRRRLYILES